MSQIAEDNEKCSRCKTRQYCFVCSDCEVLKEYCDQCDYFVHSNEYKENHKREKIERRLETVHLINDNQTKNSFYENQKNFFKKHQITQTYRKYDSKESNRETENTDNPISSNERKSLNIEKLNSNKDINQITKQKLYEKNDNSNNFYSKDYILELKRFFEGEKLDLVKKNNSLIKEIQTLKSEYNQNVNVLESQLFESSRQNQLYQSVSIDENKSKYLKIIDDKETEIRSLHNKLKDQEDLNNTLLNNLNDKTLILQEIKQSFFKQLNQLELNIQQNETENKNLKSYYENKITYLNQSYDDEKTRIIKNYEENINQLVEGHKKSKEKLTAIISEKNEEYTKLLNETDQKKITMEKEIEKLKFSLDEFETKNNNLNNHIQTLKSEYDLIKKKYEETLKDFEQSNIKINNLENENRNLVSQSEGFKGKLHKFDKIVYGKFDKSEKIKKNR